MFISGNAFDGLSTFTSPNNGYYEFSFAGTAGVERKHFPDQNGTNIIVEKNGEDKLKFLIKKYCKSVCPPDQRKRSKNKQFRN